MGFVRFGAPKELVTWLKGAFGVTAFVETGTNKAETTVWAAHEFERVYTIEAFEPLYHLATERYGGIYNIQFFLGDSRTILRQLMPSLTKPAIIWLDAHWCGEDTFGKGAECPVLEELAAINEAAVDHFVLIDDASFFVLPAMPPHDPDHWPNIREICAALAAHSSNRYVIIFEDVIVAVPEWAKPNIINYIRTPRKPTTDSHKENGYNRWIKSLKSRFR
jgi:hypothetical protein